MSPATREQQLLLRRQILGWRAAASIAWSVLLLPLCTAAFISISSIDFFHPVQWITNSFNDLYTSYVIFCVLLMSVVILIISIFNVEFHAVVPSISCSRLALISKIIHPQQVIHSVAHAVMGMLVAWCAAVMMKGKFQFLSASCTATESTADAIPPICLNEYHLFLLFLGAFMGYSYSLRYLVNNMNYLPFPIIQQYKYLRFRRSLPLLVKHSCVESLYMVRNFCAAYYFFGYIPRAWIITTMNFHTDSQLHPLDTVAGLLDLSLLYHSWLCGVFLLITWYIAWLLFRIYATEAYHFPVQPTFTEETDQCLPKILNSSPPPILKFLALQDLMFLSQYSPMRRQEVFSLSQPGGHPHNWTAISKECLNLLSNLTQKLITHQEAAAANGRLKQPSEGDLTPSPSPPAAEESSFQTPKTSILPRAHMPSLVKSSLLPLKASPVSDLGSNLGSPFNPLQSRKAGILELSSPWHGSVQSPHIMRRGPKLWTSNSDLEWTSSPYEPFSATATGKVANEAVRPSSIYTWLQNKKEQVKSFLSKRVLIMYFFSKHPEASIQDLFSDTQMHIWALEGLSHLVAASFTEDRYGVVQTTLPAVLNTLLTLQEVVDKHFKLPHVSSKPPRISGNLADTSYKTLRFALRTSLKTAIYRITTTFGEHLNAVQVSSEHKKRLQQFLEFKE
ncbi:nucleoporin NDC1 isoform X2 [Hemicordylus capensis]|uniref:nucleoporin NDC1 isoform X2 n=1 Tax=Hemicordylus capensis TaxID=884348 RepID=UPI0023039B36|nr:nucleoporin NDC1 isoform X2 [Hemicordylus capensis]